MGTPAAYKGEHFSRSVWFNTQEMDASAFTCLLRLQRHSRVPEKSEVLMSLALGNLFYCFGRSMVVWCELRGPPLLVRSRKRTEEGDGTEWRFLFTVPQKSNCWSCQTSGNFLLDPSWVLVPGLIIKLTEDRFHMRRTSFNSCTWRSHRNGTFKVATAGNFYTCRQRNNAFGRNWQDKQIWWWVLN